MINKYDARACSVNANSDLNEKALAITDQKITQAAEEGFFTCILDFKEDFGYEGTCLKSVFHSFFEELEKNEFRYELRSMSILISWKFEE